MAAAGDALIGALRISLSADTAAFETGLKSAQTSLGKFGKAMVKPLAAIGVALAGAAGAMAVGIKGAINDIDGLSKASQKFGVPIEQLSKLAYAGELADVSLEQLGNGMKKLSVNMAEVAAGAGGKAADAFKQLGISVTNADGSLKSSEAVLYEVSNAFESMENGARKTALASAILGKSIGPDLIPLLNGGAQGLREAAKEAEQLGLVIDQKTGASAERFNDNLTRLGKVIQGVFIQLAAEAAEPLARLTDRLVDIAKNGRIAETVAGLFKQAIDAMGPALIRANAEIERLGRLFSFLSEAFSIWRSSNDAAVVFEGISAAASRLHSDMKGIADETARLLGDERWKQLAGMAPQLQASSSSAGTATPAAAVATATAPIAEPVNIIPPGFEDALTRIGEVSESIGQTWNSIADTLATSVTGALKGLLSGTQNWKQALGGVLDSWAQVLTQMAAAVLKALVLYFINQAISGGQPGAQLAGNFGAGVGSGIGNALAGFAQGGSFKVGGTGGIDSQLVQFMATPGEVVDVSHGEDMGPEQSIAINSTVNVGAGVSQVQVRAALDQLHKQILKSLPANIRTARTRGLA